jgi:hypothetical protein
VGFSADSLETQHCRPWTKDAKRLHKKPLLQLFECSGNYNTTTINNLTQVKTHAYRTSTISLESQLMPNMIMFGQVLLHLMFISVHESKKPILFFRGRTNNAMQKSMSMGTTKSYFYRFQIREMLAQVAFRTAFATSVIAGKVPA